MICKKCAAAADGIEGAGHCGFANTLCDCQHKPVGTGIAEGLAKALRDAGPDVVAEVAYRLADDALRADPDLQESLAQARRGEVVPAQTRWEDENPAEVIAKFDAAVAEGRACLTVAPPVMLTSVDPEPPRGSRVLCLGDVWKRTDDDDWPGKSNWQREVDGFGEGDVETWTKIAGNYGPVELLEEA